MHWSYRHISFLVCNVGKSENRFDFGKSEQFFFENLHLNMEHTMRDIVSNGDTFAFARMVNEQKYDLSSPDSVYDTLLHVCIHIYLHFFR